ncbi:MAG: hypothetical protein HPY76_05750, partial [Anaerolineae bacterium]|nr:hypothetical protein [Anaerolineae bacterium]
MDGYRKSLTQPPSAWLARVASLLALLLMMALATRRAWLSDDAYITFRTVDNFINGYGLNWNPAERVQSYTHPLWMFLLSAATLFTHEFYVTPILLSLALTAICGILLWRTSDSSKTAAPLLLLLSFSPIFIDFSTGGLENPLSHALMAAFLLVYLRGKPTRLRPLWLSLLASLAAFNRLDTMLLYLPALLAVWLKERKWSTLGWLTLGQTPLVLWEAFSLLYYGFPFPNTFYAKLNTGIPQAELWQHGWYYLQHALRFDPLLPAMLLAVIVFVLWRRRLDVAAIVVGMLLYLVYILSIGGDFMGGRFFSVLMVAGAGILAQIQVSRLRLPQWAALFVPVIILGLLAPLPTYKVLSAEIQQHPDRGIFDQHAIADERQTYFFHTGFLLALQGEQMPQHWYIDKAREAASQAAASHQTYVTPQINIGIFGFYAGPQVHIVDRYALSDPLLSRLPTFRTYNWRIGHFTRPIPEGYLETLASGRNQL